MQATRWRLCARVLGLAMVAVIALIPLHAMAAPAITQGISGTVTDSVTHLPIANASVEIWDNTQNPAFDEEVMTGSDGTYSMELPAGIYNVRVTNDHYYDDQVAGIVVPGTDTNVDPAVPVPVVVHDVVLERYEQPVYRFLNLKNGVHFWTADDAERDHVIATWPTVYKYEGVAWMLDVGLEDNANNKPLYRFWDVEKGYHLYVMDENEKQHIMDTWPTLYKLEGIAYYVSDTPMNQYGQPQNPVYRYYNTNLRVHFYSIVDEWFNKSIKDNPYHYEGIAFWLGNNHD